MKIKNNPNNLHVRVAWQSEDTKTFRDEKRLVFVSVFLVLRDLFIYFFVFFFLYRRGYYNACSVQRAGDAVS